MSQVLGDKGVSCALYVRLVFGLLGIGQYLSSSQLILVFVPR
jgi:hypothetical protein